MTADNRPRSSIVVSRRSGAIWAILAIAIALGMGCAASFRDDVRPPMAVGYVMDQRPELLSYPELNTLSVTSYADLEPDLRDRLDTLLHTPFINNEAHYAGTQPHRPVESGIGETLRVVSWNIERGLRLDLILSALAGGAGFLEHVDAADGDLDVTPELRREIEREMTMLQSADVLVLQELDWGIKRTAYREVVEELARATEMNWAYGVEFLEVDPVLLGTEEFPGAEDADRDELRRRIAVDEARYKGLHGTAVLSRYPIASARLLPLEHQGYDWFAGERAGTSVIESAKREAAQTVFQSAIGREIRHGGRTTLVVDLDVPEISEGRLTIAAAHFESRAEPIARQQQLEELLRRLHEIDNPVILAGDMNTSGQDGTPTSWKREIYQRLGDAEFWTRTGVKYLSGLGIAFDAVIGGVGAARRSNDPTVENIPVLSPNRERRFFDILEEFRFADGGAFDFRGDPSRSLNGNEGTLANSNHRDAKGFAVTFEVDRTIGPAGKLKLDWIFVKAYATDPRDPSASYRFAPHRGSTMEALNYSVTGRMSDHSPISVDLPLPAPDGRS